VAGPPISGGYNPVAIVIFMAFLSYHLTPLGY